PPTLHDHDPLARRPDPAHRNSAYLGRRPSSYYRQPRRARAHGPGVSRPDASVCWERGDGRAIIHRGLLLEWILGPSEPLDTDSHCTSQEERFMAQRLRTTSALAVVVMVLFGACSSNATPAPAASASAAAPGPSLTPAVPKVPTGYTELDKALGADKPFNGKTVSIQTQWIGGEGT